MKRPREEESTESKAAAAWLAPEELAMAVERAASTAHADGSLRLDIAGNLTEKEREILTLLLEATKASGAKTTIRVAGGWVRDKLLGMGNDDIDVALDDCSGVAFGEMVNAHLQKRGDETHSIGVIQANPDQSKHLETARMKICGEWVDLVNLRAESYSDGSRIPEVRFGTATEDAYRRDFTINALFFNVSTGQVEDLTGRGISDLERGVLATPLDPLVTFRDDPLRVLRAVRFAARFGFKLDAALAAAAALPAIREALAGKVSRERVGLEVDGMLCGKGAKPAVAFSHLKQLGLDTVVFVPPTTTLPAEPECGWNWELGVAATAWVSRLIAREQGKQTRCEREIREEGVEIAQKAAAITRPDAQLEAHAGGASNGGSSSGGGSGGGGGGSSGYESSAWAVGPLPLEPQRAHRLEFLTAALLPLREVKYPEKKGRTAPAALWVVKESLKLRSRDGVDVAAVHEALAEWEALSKQESRVADECRLQIGLLVRKVKDLWRTCIMVACAAEIANAVSASSSTSETFDAAAAIATRYETLFTAVTDLGLASAWEIKPLLDGKAVAERLNVPKGPAMGKVMEQQIRWQLQHPEGDAEACASFLAAEP